MRNHWPLRLGYFDSSNACAPVVAARHDAASATIAMVLRIMGALPENPVCLFASLRGLLEVAQVRRLLAFARRHQVAFPAQEVVFGADTQNTVALGADVLRPHREFGLVAAVFFMHRPRPRQRI